MGFLDIILLFLGISTGVGSFLTGSDSLYKLFFGLIIGFLTYLVVSYQIEITNYLSPAFLNNYQLFISKHSTAVLSFTLLMIPALWLIFMLNPRFHIQTQKGSISQILLWILLPIFLVGIFSHLSSGSILSESETWKKIFSFMEQSWLYQVFHKLPWWIFLLLWFLIFYKSIFLLTLAFFTWFFQHIILQYFRSWKPWKKENASQEEQEEISDNNLEEG